MNDPLLFLFISNIICVCISVIHNMYGVFISETSIIFKDTDVSTWKTDTTLAFIKILTDGYTEKMNGNVEIIKIPNVKCAV